MDKIQYFRLALRYGKWKSTSWVISIFARMGKREYDPAKSKPYDLVILDSDPSNLYTVLEDTSKTLLVEGLNALTPPFTTSDVISLSSEDLPNVEGTVRTTCGTAIINAVLLVYPFGKKIPYIADRINGEALDRLIVSKWIDNPDDYGTEREDPNGIYVQEYWKYATAAANIAQYSQICTSAASPKTMTISPMILKRRDELFEQHKDELTNPAIIANIIKELAELDRADFKGDAAEDFFIKDKTFFISRMKEFICYGLEYGFDKTGNNPALIKTSLAEGMDLHTFPAQADSIRAASYDRGSQTALGGAAVKEIYRALQNTKIIDGDCGTRTGRNTYIRSYNIKDLIGRLGIDSNTGNPRPLTKEILEANLGKRLMLRSPMGCHTTPPNFCSTCMGKSYSMNPNGTPIIVSEPPSVMMNDMMKSMHGRVLKTIRYNFRESMT